MFGSHRFPSRFAKSFSAALQVAEGPLNESVGGFPLLSSSSPTPEESCPTASCSLQVKEAAERALQAKNLSLDVAMECLTLRDGRRSIDVVRDPVEEELHREVKVIDKAKRELQQRVHEAFEQLW